MKKAFYLSGMIFLAVLLMGACSSAPRVQRVSADTQIDLTGRWNDSDIRLVSNSLINDVLSSTRVALFIQEYAARNGGRRPAVIVGAFRNDSSERIDTSLISRNMEGAIVNSGRLDFVAGGDTRQEIRTERQDQLGHASEATAAALGHETGAALLLTGSVNSVVERSGNTTVRAYFVNAELTDIETNTRIWMGNNDEIKKVIQQRNVRL